MQTIYAWTVATLLVSTTKAFQSLAIAKISRITLRPFSSCATTTGSRFLSTSSPSANNNRNNNSRLYMSSMASSSCSSSWDDLKALSGTQPMGAALNQEAGLRKDGNGSAHVQSKLRLFGSKVQPKITLYRDHAGWCPYCQKTMLLIEEKQVPINIELVPMRSYGDKPVEFMRMVPGGMLPAITIERDNGQKQVITESGVIMELLDQWHPESEGYKPMLPNDSDQDGWNRYNRLARLERELFSWWCTLMFRPEGPKMPSASSGSGFMGFFTGKNGQGGGEMMSGAMSGFLDCLSKVDQELSSTPGPRFFDRDYPTMIDFVYVSHVERMLASCAYWKGLNLRDGDMRKKYPGLNNWLDAFDKRECFLAFKSDYYTHIKDIPPQYGPSYNGGFEDNRKAFSKMIDGTDGKSWVLPLPFDDPIQPLYKGPPLPICALKAAGIEGDNNGSYEKCNPDIMAKACRQMAGWKLSSNGQNVAKFAARGGSAGSKNPRKSFGAELADPYAEPDVSVIPHVDNALRVVCEGLLDEETTEEGHMAFLQSLEDKVRSVVPSDKKKDVISSLAYLRDRVGVPRDLPLASARQLRAHLNWAISAL
mmetsp:Transcript_3131/g.5814  ORF Transcript_3131/g.5814 Transcript_3131/m.5814 type:complete len:592 (-) Transcript_3131:88-1863(-)